MADATCSFIGDALNELQQGKRLLIHCEAGRDRTGAVTALLAGLLLEDDGNLSDAEIKAIECDYRKSASLNPSKYGRIESLLRELRQMGGVRRFIAERCGLEQGN
jgi:protein tyrosine/serine phosphatase